MIRLLTLTTATLAAALTVAPVARRAEAAPAAKSVDCSEAYGPGKSATCEVVPCDAQYAAFLGDWSGPFEESVPGQSPVFRPYDDHIAYAAKDCLLNPANGERFIIGRRVDTYPAFGALPAKTDAGLLITGKRADGTAFLRTVDHDGVEDYALESRDATTETAVWRLDIAASSRPCPTAADTSRVCKTPATSFRVTDTRDQTAKPANVRVVTIEMTAGPAAAPYFHAVVARGRHAKREG